MDTYPVVLLAGGRGTRLGEMSKTIPKALVKIGEDPIIWHLMKYFVSAGFKDFYVLTGYLHDEIEKYFIQKKYSGSRKITVSDSKITSDRLSSLRCNVTLINTGIGSGIAYRLKLVKDELCSSPFILTYCDGLADINLQHLVEYHKESVKLKGVEVTISAYQPTSRFGMVYINQNRLVEKFQEKPKMSDWINIGFMVFQPSIFNYLDSVRKEDMLEHSVLPKLAISSKIAAFKHNGHFRAMDSYKDYVELNKYWKESSPFWKV